jgi:hypothetical protein
MEIELGEKATMRKKFMSSADPAESGVMGVETSELAGVRREELRLFPDGQWVLERAMNWRRIL